MFLLSNLKNVAVPLCLLVKLITNINQHKKSSSALRVMKLNHEFIKSRQKLRSETSQTYKRNIPLKGTNIVQAKHFQSDLY